MPPKSTSSFSPKRIWKKKSMLLGERAIIGSNLPLPFSKTPTKPKNTLNKKIPKGFGIFSKRLVRTSALPTARCFWISKMPSKLRKNTMPRRFAPRLFLTISQKVKIGGEGGIRTLDTDLNPYNKLATCRLQPLGHLSIFTQITNYRLLKFFATAKIHSEREGFEPSVHLHGLRFSRPVH